MQGEAAERERKHKANAWYGRKNMTDRRLSGRYSSVALKQILSSFAGSLVFRFFIITPSVLLTLHTAPIALQKHQAGNR